MLYRLSLCSRLSKPEHIHLIQIITLLNIYNIKLHGMYGFKSYKSCVVYDNENECFIYISICYFVSRNNLMILMLVFECD